jgi:hypothetical protein
MTAPLAPLHRSAAADTNIKNIYTGEGYNNINNNNNNSINNNSINNKSGGVGGGLTSSPSRLFTDKLAGAAALTEALLVCVYLM